MSVGDPFGRHCMFAIVSKMHVCVIFMVNFGGRRGCSASTSPHTPPRALIRRGSKCCKSSSTATHVYAFDDSDDSGTKAESSGGQVLARLRHQLRCLPTCKTLQPRMSSRV
eukprot:171925-Amphidinium_carterae.1